jgi:hypothetical protein
MTDEKIARWAGWTFYKGWRNPAGNSKVDCPNYLTECDACLGLLNVLVEKGYEVTLIYTHNGATVDISVPVGRVLVECDAPTIHEAITVAVARIIEMEAQYEQL